MKHFLSFIVFLLPFFGGYSQSLMNSKYIEPKFQNLKTPRLVGERKDISAISKDEKAMRILAERKRAENARLEKVKENFDEKKNDGNIIVKPKGVNSIGSDVLQVSEKAIMVKKATLIDFPEQKMMFIEEIKPR